jgi:glycosyltransferase involved in cell wall biosynthesis
VPKSARRLVMFTPSSQGGHAEYCAELLDALAEDSAEYEVCLVTSKDLANEFNSSRYLIHRILPAMKHKEQYKNKLLWMLGRVVHYLRRDCVFLFWLTRRTDVSGVHFQEISPLTGILALFVIKRVLRRKTWLTVHNVRPHVYPPLLPYEVVDRLNQTIWRMCDHLFVHSNVLRDTVVNAARVPPERITIVEHGVWSLPYGSPTGIAASARRLLFFGTIRPNKGLHLLIDAMKLLPTYELGIRGEISDRDYFKTQIEPRLNESHACHEKIDFRAGFVQKKDIPDLFGGCSAIVLPYTRFEAQSGILLYAIACGLPVVVSPQGAMVEFVLRYGVGTVIERELTPELIAKAVLSLEGSWSQKHANILAARNALTWGNAARQTLQAYRIATS